MTNDRQVNTIAWVIIGIIILGVIIYFGWSHKTITPTVDNTPIASEPTITPDQFYPSQGKE
jgi:hypothetical protein